MQKRILIIDDNEQDIKIMKRFLNKAGFSDIHNALTGEQGLVKFKKLKPALIILDTILPDMIGFDVCSQLRKQNAGEDLKIIMMTGMIDAVDAVKARRAGADDYCVKTADCSALIEAVRKNTEG